VSFLPIPSLTEGCARGKRFFSHFSPYLYENKWLSWFGFRRNSFKTLEIQVFVVPASHTKRKVFREISGLSCRAGFR
jgi:hypothetical protein